MTGQPLIQSEVSPVAFDIPSYVLGRGKGSGGSGGGGGGGSDAAQKNINFIDYDGEILYSYTAEEFKELTAMPESPSHAGLIAQGWNWTLENAKAYVAKYGKLWIGQMYITDDGKTRVYISLEEGRLEPYLGIAVYGTATIEWGDGATDTVSGTSVTSVISTKHTYPAPGEYIITIATDVTGSLGIVGNSSYGSQLLWSNVTTSSISNRNRVYQNAVQKVELGRNVSIVIYSLQYCYSLTSITIPNSVTSIGAGAFQYCYSLTSITIPNSITSIGNVAFSGCCSLTSIAIPHGVMSIAPNAFSDCSTLISVTIPSSVTSIGGNAFQYCYGLTSVTIPDSVTSIGNSAFSSCFPLTSITIPSSVTSIGSNAFQYCYNLTNVTISHGVTSIGASAFSGCRSLTSITIPDSVTSIGSNAFQHCHSLTSITILRGVTSIGGNAFHNCYSLTNVTIPDSVTSIGASAFLYCYGLGFIRFTATTPPAVAVINAWTGIPTDCIIYVPSGTLTAYTSAANYPSSSSYTYVEY